MRNPTIPVTQIVAELIRQGEEIKQTQLVGTDQILAKTTTTNSMIIMLSQPFIAEPQAIVAFRIEVTPTNLADGNIFISNVTPIVTNNDGSRHGVYDYGISQIKRENTQVNMRIKTNDRTKDTHYISITGTMNEIINVKFRITSSSSMTYKVTKVFG